MRKWLIVLMAAVTIGATGILGWLYMRQDRKGPEITIAESKKNSYTADMTTEDLLEGVKAVDERDGDVFLISVSWICFLSLNMECFPEQKVQDNALHLPQP